MALSDHDRRMYERQLLLAEVGEPGQQRLIAARVALRPDSDRSAAATAQRYLQRAGVRIDETAHGSTRVAEAGTARQVERWAGSPRLREAAAYLGGSVAAVEAIKAIVEAGTPAPLPEGWTLGPEEP